MFFIDMYYKLASEATDSHGDDIRVGDPSLYPGEKSEEGITRQDVIQIFVGQQDDTFLFLVDVVDFH